MNLADVLNAPTEFTLDGVTYRIRKPTLLEQAEYQRWLEQLAFEAIDRRTYQDEAAKLSCLRMHDQDCAAGVYEWGGQIVVQRLMTPRGLAKLLAIICRGQGLDEEKAERLVDLESKKIAMALVSKATQDPKILTQVGLHLGLPAEHFSSSCATHHSTTESTTSAP